MGAVVQIWHESLNSTFTLGQQHSALVLVLSVPYHIGISLFKHIMDIPKKIRTWCPIPDLFWTIFRTMVQIRTKSGIPDLIGPTARVLHVATSEGGCVGTGGKNSAISTTMNIIYEPIFMKYWECECHRSGFSSVDLVGSQMIL